MAENEPKETPGPEAPAPAVPENEDKPKRIVVELSKGEIRISGGINDTVLAAGILTRGLWYIQKRVDDEMARAAIQKKILDGMRDGTFRPPPRPGKPN